MNYQPLPLIDIPLDLSDEAAAKLIDFLLQGRAPAREPLLRTPLPLPQRNR